MFSRAATDVPSNIFSDIVTKAFSNPKPQALHTSYPPAFHRSVWPTMNLKQYPLQRTQHNMTLIKRACGRSQQAKMDREKHMKTAKSLPKPPHPQNTPPPPPFLTQSSLQIFPPTWHRIMAPSHFPLQSPLQSSRSIISIFLFVIYLFIYFHSPSTHSPIAFHFHCERLSQRTISIISINHFKWAL